MSTTLDCPKNLAVGDKIRVVTAYGDVEAEVDTITEGTWKVRVGSVLCDFFPDPTVYAWTKIGDTATYGVRCTDKYCNEWFEHAVAVPNFKCYSCRNR